VGEMPTNIIIYRSSNAY